MILLSFCFFLSIFNLIHQSNAYQCFELKNSNQCNQCEFGSECILSNDRTNRNVTCKCIENCLSFGDSVDSRTVCAEDGNVYESICNLHKRSCQLQKHISIKYNGKCDPCKEFNCPPNQTCIVDSINRQPICQCDDNCDSFPFDPVCGTDGKTYINECTLLVQACKQRRDLKVLSKGDCKDSKNDKLCEIANCSNYELCDIDSNGKASCICQLECSPIYVPICGSNSITYDSICELKKNACIQKQEILILYYGICGQQSQCENYQCNFGSVCQINSTTFQPYCECEKELSMEYHPVCGSDGITYRNHFFLKRTSCLTQTEINPLYDGTCDQCLIRKCENEIPYSTCKVNVSDQQSNNQTAECVCIFDCDQQKTNDLIPVCANEVKTGLKQIFPNECELKKRSCETKTELTIISDLSICELCKEVHCKYGATCYMSKCICPTDCPKDLFEPVCSNLGITFANECELRRTACMNSRNSKNGTLNYDKLDNYTILFYGDCNKQENTNEMEVKLIPVLGKSSILLSNQMIGSYMTICNENACKFGGKCYYSNDNGLPSCLCSFDCPPLKNDKKICGSDGRTYLNHCKLQEEACLRQQKIETLPLKNCLINKNLSICNGTLPEFDRVSGKFIDCNKKSIFHRECSTNYTCLYHRKVIPSIKTLLTFKDQDHFCCSKQNIDQSNFDSINELLESKLIEQQQQNRCDCNKLGSELPIRCDEKGQCVCKRALSGLKCDRCMTGYYGFHKINQGNDGCLKCGCNLNGSLRSDCEQTTGQCVCKNGVYGMKCDICLNGKKLTSFGCIDDALLKVHKKNCSSVKCRFGAVCKEISPNRSQCVCNYACRKRYEVNYQRRLEREDESFSYLDNYYGDLLVNTQTNITRKSIRDKPKYLSRLICGSDENTHLNECEMRIHGCRMQKKIVKVKDGQCPSTKELTSDNYETSYIPAGFTSQTPIRRSTLEKELGGDFYDLIDETSIAQQFSTESTLNVNLYTNLYEEDKPNFNPMFLGTSFMRLSRLESNSYLKLEIELIPFSERGIIFYSGQSTSGVGDFISLTLNNGYFEFRFNLGSGISTLRSKQKMIKYVVNKVTLIKNFRQGILIVNDQDEVSTIAEGAWRSLDLNENFFIGHLKSDFEKIYENLNGVRTGFVGCLMKLELGKNDKDLENIELLTETNRNNLNDGATTSIIFEHTNAMNRKSKMKILEIESIKNCSSINQNKINFCQKYNSCTKGSICINLINNTFDCICPFNEKCMGYTKSTKQPNQPNTELTTKNIYTLDLWGESWIKSKNLLVNVARCFAIEIWFLTRHKDGLLIYAQKSKKGDFLSLNLKNNRLEFIFNLGSKIQNISGVVTIRSDELITLNSWHKVKITRFDDYATMQLDDGPIYSGQAKGNLTELNLDEFVYIGGMPNFNESNVEANLTNQYFNGAFQRMIFNGLTVMGSNLLTRPSTEHVNISEFFGPPCLITKCDNRSQCIPILNDYECKNL